MELHEEMKTEKELLKLNLQYFAGEGEGESESGEGESSDGKENTDKAETNEDHMIPKSRFDEVNESYKEMKKEMDAFKEQQSKAEKERQEKEKEEAEKRGEYEQLYKQAQTDFEATEQEKTAAKERVESLESVINGLLETKLESIDEDYHDLIPENLTPEQKLNWVNNAEKKGLFANKANEPVGEQTNPKGGQETKDVNKMNPMEKILSGYGRK